MDLPTYTNIWRIEKRLYKLYDFRLPMPLPINWIAVFAGITIPYIVLLIAIGLPFNHTLVWLYVLPPGVLTWLTTRPVIESKRLPELVESQVRYLTEPRTWVRLTPLSEKDQIVLTARVWHGRGAKRPAPARRPVPAARPALPSAEPERQVQAAAPRARACAQAHLGLPAGTRPGRRPGTGRPAAPGPGRAAASQGTRNGPGSRQRARGPGPGQERVPRARNGPGLRSVGQERSAQELAGRAGAVRPVGPVPVDRCGSGRPGLAVTGHAAARALPPRCRRPVLSPSSGPAVAPESRPASRRTPCRTSSRRRPRALAPSCRRPPAVSPAGSGAASCPGVPAGPASPGTRRRAVGRA